MPSVIASVDPGSPAARAGLLAGETLCAIDGKPVHFPSRAPSYNANVWECDAYYAMNSWEGYTYYLPVTEDMIGREIKLYGLFINEGKCDMDVVTYLCDGNNEKQGIVVEL